MPLASDRGDRPALLRIGRRADHPGITASPPQGGRGAEGPAAAAEPPAQRARAKSGQTVLDHVDLSQKLTDRRYREELEKYQGRLTRLTWEANARKISTVAVFEGWDAAGKGGARSAG